MSAQQILLSRYGSPEAPGYLIQSCHIWVIKDEFPWFPANSFLINNDFRTMLTKAFHALEAAGVQGEIETYDGCYNDRTVRGSVATSLHAWACAIDLNAAENPMTTSTDPALRHGKWSPLFIQAMKSAGVFFGGDFKVRADSMHWAMLDG